jgi:NAD(P)-dependent dehydrogenase (short-subunit alcohol dehydrogenase family)
MTRRGSITVISGSSARRPGTGFGVWTALHGAIEALARAAALELAPLRVNVVSPGGIGLHPDRQLTEHRGAPEDIGQAVLALITNPAITNAVLDVDGGERLGVWSGEANAR